MSQVQARAETLIRKMLSSGRHVGKTFDLPALPGVIAAGLPAEVNINGQRIRCGATADVIDERGNVLKSQPMTDALRDSLLVSHAVAAIQRGHHVG